jgi:Flp pilus assembly protein TadG
MSDPGGDDRRNDKGSVMVIAALAMVALVLFAALAVDVGFMWSSRTQSQNVGDSAAIAAAQTMIVPDPAKPPIGKMFDEAGATAAGIDYASQNSTVANPSVTLLDSDFTYGNWNLDTRTLEPGDPANPNSMTGVRVNVRMDGTENSRSPGLLSRILQKSDGSRPFAQGFDVNNTAVAYLGFQGKFNPGEFNLPVALDSCKLTGDGGCGTDFCTKTQPACPLIKPQSDTAPLMCGEFSATTTQNMCWTAFDGESPTINKKLLTDIVKSGNAGDVKAGDPVFLDNGDKTSTVDYIRDKFYGCGSFSKQVTPHDDDYGPGTFANSWVVKLPVVECQDATHCAGGDTFKIVGGVCFEIREIVAPAAGKTCPGPSGAPGDRIIKGRPLCPESTNPKVRQLYKDHCKPPDGPIDPGGCGFGFRASRVVLVE